MGDLNDKTISELAEVAARYCYQHGLGEVREKKGVGASGVVFAVGDEKNLRALKLYDPSLFQGPSADAERRRVDLQKNLIGLNCGSLVKLYDVTIFEDTCLMLMEYVPWPELKSVLTAIPPGREEALIKQLVEAVMTLEGLGLVHRDIKPANILINPEFDRLKLVDFGVIREISREDGSDGTDQGNRKPFVATAQYSSPEYLFRTVEPSANLWKALNLYQVGAVLHDLLTRKPLFIDEVESENRYRVARAVERQTPTFPDAIEKAFPRLVSLAECCLVKDMAARLSMVNLENFCNSPASPAVLLAEKLAQRSNFDSHEWKLAGVKTKLRADRHKWMGSLGEAIHNKMIELYGNNFPFTWLNNEGNGCDLPFKIALPNGKKSTGINIHIDWQDAGDAEGVISLVFDGVDPAGSHHGAADHRHPPSPALVMRLVDVIASNLDV